MKKLQSYFQKSILVWLILLVLALVISSFLFSFLRVQVDMTADRLFTLSKGTVKVVQGLKKPIQIQFYYSRSNTALPQTLKNYANRVEDMLKSIQVENPKMVKLVIVDPKPDSDEEAQAIRSGMQTSPLGDSNFILGALLTQGEKEQAIPLFDPNRERYLEYDISRVVFDLTVERKNTMGFLTPVNFGPNPNNANRQEDYFLTTLKRAFRFSNLDYTNLHEVPVDIETLLVFHPREISDQTEYAIDQFLLRGGKLIVVVDPFFRNEPDGLALRQKGMGSGPSFSNLNRELDKWGLDYRTHSILGDRTYATVVNNAGGQYPYALWFTGNASTLNQGLPYVGGINDILLEEPGAFRIKPVPGITAEPIMHSSDKTDFAYTLELNFSDPFSINGKLKADQGVYQIMAILKGDFPSAYDGRPLPDHYELAPKDRAAQKAKDASAAEKLYTLPHLSKSSKPSEVLFITDADWLMDGVAVDRVNIYGQNLAQNRNDNLRLFFSLVDRLYGNDQLNQIEPRVNANRPFTQFLNMQKAAQQNYSRSEAALQGELTNLENEVKSLKPAQGSAKVDLPAETLNHIKQVQAKEMATKQKLREIRRLLREGLDRMKTSLSLLNILLVPIAMLVLGIYIYRARGQRKS